MKVHYGGLNVDAVGTGGQAAWSLSFHRATGTGGAEAEEAKEEAGHLKRL